MNGKQMTVTWHVDNLKVSHLDGAEIDKFGVYHKRTYEKADLKVTEHKGVVHDYLGIDLDYSTSGSLRVSMIKYLENTLTGFSGNIGKLAATRALEHLFKVREEAEAEYLSEERAQEFHRVTV